jgi:alpha-galactosidase
VRSVEFCTDPAECGQWIAGLANLWRTTEDIQPTYDSMMSNIHENDKMAAIAQPGHFNDPDMMNVGVVGLSLVEQYTHMSLWCVAGAPLLVGADIVHATAETLAILTNKEVIGINQDLGYQGAVQGRIVAKYSSPMTEVWSKRLEDGNSYGVVLLNLDSSPANITAQWSDLGGLSGPAAVRDLWSHEERGMFDGSFQAEVPSHGVVFVRVTRQTVVI